jgi:hypothetical protein
MEWSDKDSRDIPATDARQRTPAGCLALVEALFTTTVAWERKRGVAINVRET